MTITLLSPPRPTLKPISTAQAADQRPLMRFAIPEDYFPPGQGVPLSLSIAHEVSGLGSTRVVRFSVPKGSGDDGTGTVATGPNIAAGTSSIFTSIFRSGTGFARATPGTRRSCTRPAWSSDCSGAVRTGASGRGSRAWA